MSIIRTNNQPREFLDSITSAERAKFDWLSPEETSGFFRFQGDVYHLGQFVNVNGSLPGWDGMCPTSATTGVLVKITDGKVIVGIYRSDKARQALIASATLQ